MRHWGVTRHSAVPQRLMAVTRQGSWSPCGGGDGRGRLLPQPILDGPLASGIIASIQIPRSKHAELANIVQNIPASQRILLPSWFQRHKLFTTHECYPSMFVIIQKLPPILLDPGPLGLAMQSHLTCNAFNTSLM